MSSHAAGLGACVDTTERQVEAVVEALEAFSVVHGKFSVTKNDLIFRSTTETENAFFLHTSAGDHQRTVRWIRATNVHLGRPTRNVCASCTSHKKARTVASQVSTTQTSLENEVAHGRNLRKIGFRKLH